MFSFDRISLIRIIQFVLFRTSQSFVLEMLCHSTSCISNPVPTYTFHPIVLYISPNTHTHTHTHTRTLTTHFRDKVLEEVPPSGTVEFYYEGRRDKVTQHLAQFTELLATLEFYFERSQTHSRNLNKLLELAKRSSH